MTLEQPHHASRLGSFLRYRAWFFGGMLLGILLGLATVVPVLTMMAPALDGSGSFAETGRVDSSPASTTSEGCRALADSSARLFARVEQRQLAQAQLTAHLGAGLRAVGAVREGRGTSIAEISAHGFTEQSSYTVALARLSRVLERADSAHRESWALLAEASETLRRCRAAMSSATITPDAAASSGRAVDQLQDLDEEVASRQALLDESLERLTDLPRPVDLMVVRDAPVDPRSPSRSEFAAGIDPSPFYIDWPAQRIWAFGGAKIPIQNGRADRNRDEEVASGRVRIALYEGLMATRVDPERTLRDLVSGTPVLRSRLRQLIESADVSLSRQTEAGAIWADTGLPFLGSDSLMQVVLPFAISRTDTFDFRSNRSGCSPAQVLDEKGENYAAITAVVLDARGLRWEPALLPRIVSESGALVADVSLFDPNVVAENGFVTYATYEGQARYQAGPRPLWIAVRSNGKPGELAVPDPDGQTLRSLLGRNPRSLETRGLMILID